MSEPEIVPWTRLFLISLAVFVACKWLTYRRALPRLKVVTLRRRLGYWLLWPGMDACAFLDPERSPDYPSAREWFLAVGKTLVGGTLLGVVARQIPPTSGFWRDWTVLIGLGLCAPFGALQLVALGWRAAGVNARPIMNRPFVASSLTEFWGRRWNRAFRDVAHDLVFRPLTGGVGAGAALAATFLFSGLFHELTLSVPAAGGFGRPTAYFLLQLAGVYVERSAVGRRLGLRHGWRGRLFCWAVTVSPAYAVFHRPLLDNVVFPWLGTMGLL